MSTDFSKLIQSLKQDIQTVGGEDATIPDRSEFECVLNAAPILGEEVAKTTSSGNNEKLKKEWWNHPMVKLFVKKFLLSSELFLFFVLLLSILRPKWIYKKERRVHRNQNVIVPVFSYLYLVVYSLFFTGLIHFFIYVQKRVLRTIDR